MSQTLDAGPLLSGCMDVAITIIGQRKPWPTYTLLHEHNLLRWGLNEDHVRFP